MSPRQVLLTVLRAAIYHVSGGGSAVLRAAIGCALGGGSAVLRAAIGYALGGDSVPCGGSPGGDFAQKTGIGAHRKRHIEFLVDTRYLNKTVRRMGSANVYMPLNGSITKIERIDFVE